jgi:hypothetical protein
MAYLYELRAKANRDPNVHEISLCIDAICINQTDISERNDQVQLMKEICRNATCRLSWLGPEGEDSWLAKVSMQEFAKGIRSFSPKEDITWWERFAEILGVAKDPYAMIPNLAWMSISSLFRRTYWQRSWTFQEALIPKHVLVQCGSAVCPLDDLVQFYDWWTDIAKSVQCPRFFHPLVWSQCTNKHSIYNWNKI